ncbi:hypothetical protein [Embleya sp. NPDC020886]
MPRPTLDQGAGAALRPAGSSPRRSWARLFASRLPMLGHTTRPLPGACK